MKKAEKEFHNYFVGTLLWSDYKTLYQQYVGEPMNQLLINTKWIVNSSCHDVKLPPLKFMWLSGTIVVLGPGAYLRTTSWYAQSGLFLFYSILSHILARSSGHHRWICNNPFPSWPIFSCLSWAGKVHSCPLFDIVFPPLLLSSSFSFSFHCVSFRGNLAGARGRDQCCTLHYWSLVMNGLH